MSTPSRIVMLVEGASENALKVALKDFLDRYCRDAGLPRVGLDMKPMDSDLLSEQKLRYRIRTHLEDPRVRGLIVLIDVKCASRKPFQSAQEALDFLSKCGPADDPRFRPHVALHELEAWLLPFWQEICRKLKIQQQPPGGAPEAVNHNHPPSHHLNTLYRRARRKYNKVRDAPTILTTDRLPAAAQACPHLRELLNSLQELASMGEQKG